LIPSSLFSLWTHFIPSHFLRFVPTLQDQGSHRYTNKSFTANTHAHLIILELKHGRVSIYTI
jgi:hypothetical protein